MRINKRVVDGLSPSTKDYTEWDDDLTGFGIRVWPSGKKIYQARYRQSGKQRFFKIGEHGAITPDQARRAAQVKLGEVAAGEDPQLDRQTRRKSMTVSDLCDAYMQDAHKGLVYGKDGGPKKASTLRNDQSRIDYHIKPLLGRKLVIDLTRKDVAAFFRDVTEGRTARTAKGKRPRGMINITGGKGTASKAKGFLGGILSYAVERGVITSCLRLGRQITSAAAIVPSCACAMAPACQASVHIPLGTPLSPRRKSNWASRRP